MCLFTHADFFGRPSFWSLALVQDWLVPREKRLYKALSPFGYRTAQRPAWSINIIQIAPSGIRCESGHTDPRAEANFPILSFKMAHPCFSGIFLFASAKSALTRGLRETVDSTAKS